MQGSGKAPQGWREPKVAARAGKRGGCPQPSPGGFLVISKEKRITKLFCLSWQGLCLLGVMVLSSLQGFPNPHLWVSPCPAPGLAPSRAITGPGGGWEAACSPPAAEEARSWPPASSLERKDPP